MIRRKIVSFAAQLVHPSSETRKPHTSDLTTVPTRLGPIDDICTAISTSTSRDTERCLGFLSGDDTNKHTVFLVESANEPVIIRKSLQGLLERSKQRVPGQGMSWKDSLSVAVTLASSIIQLDGTGWLKQQWDSDDIVLLAQQSSVDYTHPYLSWKILPEGMRSQVEVHHTHSTNRPIRCDALISLGVTLVELCFGQSISRLIRPEDATPDERSRRRSAAIRLLSYVDMERGETYGDVVRRCLECPFDVHEKNLDNETFQRAVFERIVLPLHEELKNFIR